MVNENSLSWDPVAYSVQAICTDGAPAMLRKNSGFTAIIKKINSNVVFGDLCSSLKRFDTEDSSHLQNALNAVIQASSKQGH
jgi:hypothetical protein